jgi:hypothetical protein
MNLRPYEYVRCAVRYIKIRILDVKLLKHRVLAAEFCFHHLQLSSLDSRAILGAADLSESHRPESRTALSLPAGPHVPCRAVPDTTHLSASACV